MKYSERKNSLCTLPLREFVFVQKFNRRRDVPYLTHISTHKRDRKRRTHQAG